MSEMDKFMGKASKAKAEPTETPAEIAASAGISSSTLERLLEALVAANLQKTAPPAVDAPDITAQVNAQPNIDMNDRVWIVLNENKNISRSGQFFGVNGASFLLRPGKKAYVPRALVDVLNNAVEGVPIVDPDTLIVTEWRDTLRYPYQIVSAP